MSWASQLYWALLEADGKICCYKFQCGTTNVTLLPSSVELPGQVARVSVHMVEGMVQERIRAGSRPMLKRKAQNRKAQNRNDLGIIIACQDSDSPSLLAPYQVSHTPAKELA